MTPASADDTVKTASPPLFKRLFKRFFFYLFFLIVLVVVAFLSTVAAGFFTSFGGNLASPEATISAIVLAYLIAKFNAFTDQKIHAYLIIAVLLSFLLDFTAVAINLILLPQILKKFKLI